MRKLLTIIILLTTFTLSAQENTHKYDLRIGVGTSLLGTGDMLTLNFENELNKKLTSYYSSSLSLNYGRSYWQNQKRASYFQGNFNFYVSPFKNTRTNNFRIGTGLSYINLSNTYLTYSRTENGITVESQYALDVHNSLGYNIVIEDDQKISEKFLIGFKINMQNYFNGDTNGGFTFKFGIIL